ncbi:unnamed protein product [Lupinus luteus]|uniref:DNA mismatch repair proteins mutS family domain-containing protein n=1 Tax=Lupinus luteus TaxID=3873 RepID=A0AAV1VZG9_LUPLU
MLRDFPKEKLVHLGVSIPYLTEPFVSIFLLAIGIAGSGSYAHNPSYVCLVSFRPPVFNYGSCVAYPLSGIHVPLMTHSIQAPSRGRWRIRKGCSSGTHNSLVALDELGRETSTSYGQAIAEAVLEYLVRKVQCLGLFLTHYHRLAIDYHQDPKVSLCHMACQVGDRNVGVDEVTFLYRLTPGACPKSYGINVARLPGLRISMLKKAVAKSIEFEAMYDKCRTLSSEANSFEQNLFDEMIAIIQQLFNVVKVLNCRDTILCSTLIELQGKARELLQRL